LAVFLFKTAGWLLPEDIGAAPANKKDEIYIHKKETLLCTV